MSLYDELLESVIIENNIEEYKYRMSLNEGLIKSQESKVLTNDLKEYCKKINTEYKKEYSLGSRIVSKWISNSYNEDILKKFEKYVSSKVQACYYGPAETYYTDGHYDKSCIQFICLYKDLILEYQLKINTYSISLSCDKEIRDFIYSKDIVKYVLNNSSTNDFDILSFTNTMIYFKGINNTSKYSNILNYIKKKSDKDVTTANLGNNNFGICFKE